MEERTNLTDVAVVGGGLGGLATATYAARAGRSVILYEKASALGGRAVTTQLGELRVNLGPHALYAGSHGIAVLRELGVPFTGGKPSPSGAFALADGTKHALPGGFLSLLTTGLFGLSAKLETARLLGGFGRLDPRPLARLPIGEWIDANVRHPEVRQLVAALVRVATYSHDPARLSAGSALAQVQSALGASVLLSRPRLADAGRRLARRGAGGWRTHRHRDAGNDRGATGRSVACPAGGRHGDRRQCGRRGRRAGCCRRAFHRRGADHGAALGRGGDPGRAACLDLALSRLPQPRATFALGIDCPLYLSVHSAVAALAPPGNAVIHVAKYLGSAASDPKTDERELEAAMDLVQPGWRELVIQRRFLPDMLVANALPTAANGGTEGRPGPAVPGADDLYVVGDWVGPDGLLADASLASASGRELAPMHARRQPARAAA